MSACSGLSILIAIITAPHLHLHDLTLLIFPILFVAHEGVMRLSEPPWVLFPVGASLFLISGILLDAVYFIVPYILFVALARLLLS